jgi:hypothetical protein
MRLGCQALPRRAQPGGCRCRSGGKQGQVTHFSSRTGHCFAVKMQFDFVV